MIIGFTGTRQGMTRKQKEKLLSLLDRLNAEEFHHGDCIGADAEAHSLVEANYYSHTVVHPPIKSVYRAMCNADETRDPKHYLDRNRDIVNQTDLLIAAPKEEDNFLRSGTWATVRFARRQKKPLIIILPNGKVVSERAETLIRDD